MQTLSDQSKADMSSSGPTKKQKLKKMRGTDQYICTLTGLEAGINSKIFEKETIFNEDPAYVYLLAEKNSNDVYLRRVL